MSSPGQLKRIRRIQRKASPKVVAAYREGKISARLADTLLYLPPGQQARELTRRLKVIEKRTQVNRITAETIRRYLDTPARRANKKRIDLNELAAAIREAVN